MGEEAAACAPRVLSMRGSIAVLTLRLISTAAIWEAVRLEISCSSWLGADAGFCLELAQPMIALRRQTLAVRAVVALLHATPLLP